MIEERKTKVCSRCGKEQPVEKFGLGKYFHRASICNKCQWEIRKAKNAEQAEMPWYSDPIINSGRW